MASTDARPFPLKNTAYRVTFPILDADGDLVTGASSPDSEFRGLVKEPIVRVAPLALGTPRERGRGRGRVENGAQAELPCAT